MRKSRCQWIFNHAPWSKAEEDYLRANRATMTAKAIAAALPGRTRDAVDSRCKQLRIYKRDLRHLAPPAPPAKRLRPDYWWTTREIDVLRDHPNLPRHLIKRYYLPQRSLAAITAKRKELGLRPAASSRMPYAGHRDLQVAA